MRGFLFVTPLPLPPGLPPGATMWCARDAFCELMGWPPDSEDHRAFIENARVQDLSRLAAHLGLMVFDRDNQSEITAARLAHPGIVVYDLAALSTPEGGMSHLIYEPNMWNHKGLPSEYDEYQPKKVFYYVDTSQSPRTSAQSLG
jgi:hypothetical protein